MPSASPSYHQQQDNDSDSGRRTPVSFRAFKRLSSAVPLSSVAASGHDRPSSSSDLDPTPTTSTRSKPPPKPSSSTKPPFSRVRKAKAGSLSILGGRSSDKPVTPPPPHFLISQGIDAEIESQSSPKPTSGGFGSNLRLGMKKGAQDRHNMASTGPYQRNGAYIKKVIHKGIEGTTFMSEDEMRAAGIQIIKRGAEPPALPPRLAGAERPGFLERIGSPQAGSFSKEHQQVDSSSSLSSSSALGSQSLDLERPPNFTTGSSPPSPARATAVPFASTHFETGDSGSPPAPGASRQSGAATPFLSPAPGTFAHPYLNRHKVESGSYSKARAQSSASSVTSASRTLTRNAFGLGHYLSSDPASSSSSSSSPPPSKPPKPSFAFSGIEEPQSAGPVLYAKGVDTPTSDVHMLSSQLASGPSDQLSSTPMLKPPPRHKNVDSASGINQGRSSPTVGFFGQENGRLSPSSGGGAGGGGVAATLGQMGAAVGKKGWEFVRGLNGPASPAYRSGTAGGGSSSSQGGGGGWGFRTTGRASNLPQPMAADIASDVNEETRAWLEAAEISNPVNRELARSTIGLFGMPLRDAVVKTRLSADLDGSSPTSDVMPTSPRFGSKLSALDLGGDFCLPHDLLQGSLPSSPSSLKSPASPSVEACLPSKEREPLDREQARSYYLPRVVVRCIQSLEKWGPTEEGIYRLSGRSSHTNKLKGIFDSTARTNANGRSRKESSVGDLVLTEVSPADLDINSVCSVLKSYLRELPEKLIPSHLSSDFDRAGVKLTGASATGASAGIGLKNFGAAGATLSSRDAARAMDATTVAEGTKVGGERQVDLELLKSELLPVIQALPACHWYLLRELAEHLGWFASPDIVSKTKMPLSNLCLVLAPTLSISVPMLKLIVEERSKIFVAPGPEADAELDPSLTPSRSNSKRTSLTFNLQAPALMRKRSMTTGSQLDSPKPSTPKDRLHTREGGSISSPLAFGKLSPPIVPVKPKVTLVTEIWSQKIGGGAAEAWKTPQAPPRLPARIVAVPPALPARPNADGSKNVERMQMPVAVSTCSSSSSSSSSGHSSGWENNRVLSSLDNRMRLESASSAKTTDESDTPPIARLFTRSKNKAEKPLGVEIPLPSSPLSHLSADGLNVPRSANSISPGLSPQSMALSNSSRSHSPVASLLESGQGGVRDIHRFWLDQERLLNVGTSDGSGKVTSGGTLDRPRPLTSNKSHFFSSKPASQGGGSSWSGSRTDAREADNSSGGGTSCSTPPPTRVSTRIINGTSSGSATNASKGGLGGGGYSLSNSSPVIGSSSNSAAWGKTFSPTLSSSSTSPPGVRKVTSAVWFATSKEYNGDFSISPSNSSISRFGGGGTGEGGPSFSPANNLACSGSSGSGNGNLRDADSCDGGGDGGSRGEGLSCNHSSSSNSLHPSTGTGEKDGEIGDATIGGVGGGGGGVLFSSTSPPPSKENVLFPSRGLMGNVDPSNIYDDDDDDNDNASSGTGTTRGNGSLDIRRYLRGQTRASSVSIGRTQKSYNQDDRTAVGLGLGMSS